MAEIMTITDVVTGETTTRELTAEELTWRAKEHESTLPTAEQLAAQADALAAKEAAQAKLAALGLTADDLKALGLGSN
jgi:ABC-type iron transport system FetAB permease component